MKSGGRGAESSVDGENKSRGTITWRVPHLKQKVNIMTIAMKEMMNFVKERMHLDDLIQRTNSPSLRPLHPMLYPLSLGCLNWTHMMGHEFLVITLAHSKQQCIFKEFRMRSYAELFP